MRAVLWQISSLIDWLRKIHVYKTTQPTLLPSSPRLAISGIWSLHPHSPTSQAPTPVQSVHGRRWAHEINCFCRKLLPSGHLVLWWIWSRFRLQSSPVWDSNFPLLGSSCLEMFSSWSISQILSSFPVILFPSPGYWIQYIQKSAISISTQGLASPLLLEPHRSDSVPNQVKLIRVTQH